MSTLREQNERRAMQRLLQHELSTLESYEAALAELGDEAEADRLRHIIEEHRQAAAWLQQQVGPGETESRGWLGRARGPISRLRLFLAVLAGGALALLLTIITGGLLFAAILFAIVVTVLSALHYALWGQPAERALSDGHRIREIDSGQDARYSR